MGVVPPKTAIKIKEKNNMPKQKTHSGAKKRFKITKSGKVMFNRTDRGHFMTEKSQDRKRKLRRGGVLAKAQAKNIKRLINA